MVVVVGQQSRNNHFTLLQQRPLYVEKYNRFVLNAHS